MDAAKKKTYNNVGSGIISENKYFKPNSKLPYLTGTLSVEDGVDLDKPIKIAMWRNDDNKSYGVRLTQEES